MSTPLVQNLMNAYKIEALLDEDGTLVLKDLPFRAGDVVEVIFLERAIQTKQEKPQTSFDYPLKGTVRQYNKPFEPAVSPEDWEISP